MLAMIMHTFFRTGHNMEYLLHRIVQILKLATPILIFEKQILLSSIEQKNL
jgi:hypothetical protein